MVCTTVIKNLTTKNAPEESAGFIFRLQRNVLVFRFHTMLTMDRINVLKSLEIFKTIPDDHLVEVASILNERAVAAGEQIIREGELGTSMFIIVEGRVRVHRHTKDLAILGSGDVFGELAALDPEPRAASVTAVNDALLFELDGTSLYALMSDRVEVVRGLIRILCNRVRSALPS